MSIKHDYGRLLTFIVLLIVSSSTAVDTFGATGESISLNLPKKYSNN